MPVAIDPYGNPLGPDGQPLTNQMGPQGNTVAPASTPWAPPAPTPAGGGMNWTRYQNTPWQIAAIPGGGGYITDRGDKYVRSFSTHMQGEGDDVTVARWQREKGMTQGQAIQALYADYQRMGLDWNKSLYARYYNPGPTAGNPAGAAPAAPGAAQPGGGTPGAPAAGAGAGGAPGTPQPGMGGGDMNAAQRMALADPGTRYRYMMQQLNLNPDAPGILGKFLARRFQPLLEARVAASDVTGQGNYLDTIDQVIQQFAQGATQRGGGFYGNLSNIGSQAMNQGQDWLALNPDQEKVQQYMAQLNALRYAGHNPMIQAGVQGQMDAATGAYADYEFGNLGGGQELSPFARWLRQSPYRDIYY